MHRKHPQRLPGKGYQPPESVTGRRHWSWQPDGARTLRRYSRDNTVRWQVGWQVVRPDEAVRQPMTHLVPRFAYATFRPPKESRGVRSAGIAANVYPWENVPKLHIAGCPSCSLRRPCRLVEQNYGTYRRKSH